MERRKDPGAAPRPGPVAAIGPGFLAGVVGLEVCIALGYYALATVLPSVARAFAADAAFSVAAAAPLITSVVAFVLAGPWADRAGPGAPLAFGFAGLAGGEILCAAAASMPVFIAGRLLFGLGTGCVGVALYGLISHLVAEEHRGVVFGWLNSAWLLPSLVGPLVTGLIAETWGWRAVFWAVSGLMILSYAVLAAAVRGRPVVLTPRPRTRLPWAWAVLAAAALFTLHLAGQQTSTSALLASLAGLICAYAALRRLLPPGTFSARAGAPRLVALRGLLGATTSAAEMYVPYYLQHERGLRLSTSGLVMAATAIGWGAGSYLQAGLSRRWSAEQILLRGTLLVPVAPLVILAVILTNAPAVLIAAGLGVLGVGMGAAYPIISTTALRRTPAPEHASIGGALQLSEAAAAAAMLAVTGLVLALGGARGLELAYVAVLVVCAAGVAVARGSRA